METDGTGAGFFGERMLSTVLRYTKPIDFFPALSEERWNISFQRPPHGHDTWTRVRSVRSPVEARCAQRGIGHNKQQIPLCIPKPVSSKRA